MIAALLAEPLAALGSALALCVAPQAGTITFTDVAHAAGVDVVNLSGEPDKPRILDTLGCGVAWFDADGDGWLDLFVPNGATLAALQGRPADVPSDRLFRNRGDGTFEDVTARAGVADRAWGAGAAAGDYDGDGDADLYVCNLGRNVLWRNEGSGTFVDVTAAAGVEFDAITPGAAWGDFDGDVDLDLYVTAYVAFDPRNPLPAFAKKMRGMRVMDGPRGLLGAKDRLYRNEGDGRFRDVTADLGLDHDERAKGFTALFLDTDCDDRLDLLVSNDLTPNHHYVATSDGRFVAQGRESGLAFDRAGNALASMGIAVADLNDDLRPDFLMTTFANEKSAMYWSAPDGSWNEDSDLFVEASDGPPPVGWGTAFEDFDCDGEPDLAIFNGHVHPQVDTEPHGDHRYAQAAQLFRNEGKLRFRELAAACGDDFARPRCARGAGFADWDEDGDIDVSVATIDGPLVLLRNETQPRGRFLRIALRGTRCNRDGYGARVTIEFAGRRATRWITGQGSYLSQNDARAHFGVGGATAVDRVVVRWPGGREEVVPGPIAVDRTLLIREGAGCVAQLPPGQPTVWPH